METYISYSPSHHSVDFGEGEDVDYVAVLYAVVLQSVVHEVPAAANGDGVRLVGRSTQARSASNPGTTQNYDDGVRILLILTEMNQMLPKKVRLETLSSARTPNKNAKYK